MKIKSLHIKNFKSLVDLEIVEPNPFTVFVGANGVGKSNIFEALEFALWSENNRLRAFGGPESVQNRKIGEKSGYFTLLPYVSSLNVPYQSDIMPGQIGKIESIGLYEDEFEVLSKAFARYFIGRVDDQKINYSDSSKLNFACSNLEKVLKRLLHDSVKMEEIIEYLQLLIPGFENLEVQSSDLGGTETLLIYEKGTERPFTKNLISDGTYNILCLLTAVYQSDEPQFLCIEEPENGLNPFVIKELVNLFRAACEEKGHYIWLNTHSQSLVETLTPDEIILVDKVNGETKIKQIQGMNLHGLATDDAWFSGALGGGMPW